MGSVYLSEDSTGRPVALKIVPEYLSKNAEFRNRFLRECKTLDRLSHPGIPRLFEQGEHGGRMYLTMEYVEGRPVEDIVRNHPDRAGADWIAAVLSGAARILDYAHAQGVIHRDISPKNILVTDADEVKIIDFGISKVMDEVTLTMTGQYFGTPAYMAPEQFEASGSKGVDARADLWSLGVVGFWMLARRLPYESESQITLIRHIANPNEDAPLVREASRAAPPGLASVIDRLTEKNPVDRFQSAAELVAALASAKDTRVYTPRPSYARTAAERRRKKLKKTAIRVSCVAGAIALGLSVWLALKPTAEGKAQKLLKIGHWVEAEKAFRAAVAENEREGDERGLAASYIGLGRTLAELVGNYNLGGHGALEAADTALRRAEQICLKRGDAAGLAQAYNNLGWTHCTRRKLPEAESFFRKAVAVSEKDGDDGGLYEAYSGLGWVQMFDAARRSEAAENAWKSVDIAKRTGSDYFLADAYSGMGIVMASLGKTREAADAYRQAAIGFGEAGYLRKQALMYDREAGMLSRYKRSREESAEVYRRAAGLYEKLGDTLAMAAMHVHLGMVLTKTTNYPAADEAYQKAERIYVAAGDTRQLWGFYSGKGRILMGLKQFAGAEEAYLKSIAMAEQMGGGFGLASEYENLAHVREKMGNLPGADAAFGSAEAVYRARMPVEKTASPGMFATMADRLGAILMRDKRHAEAVEMFRMSAEAYEKIGTHHGVAQETLRIAHALAEMGRTGAADAAKRKATGFFLKAAEKFERDGQEANAGMMYAHVIRLLTEAGRDSEARPYAARMSRFKNVPYIKSYLGPAAAKYPEIWSRKPPADTGASKVKGGEEKETPEEE